MKTKIIGTILVLPVVIWWVQDTYLRSRVSPVGSYMEIPLMTYHGTAEPTEIVFGIDKNGKFQSSEYLKNGTTKPGVSGTYRIISPGKIQFFVSGKSVRGRFLLEHDILGTMGEGMRTDAVVLYTPVTPRGIIGGEARYVMFPKS